MHDPLSRRDAAIAAFVGALDETPDLWHSLDIRVVAVRIGDTWNNLVTRCRLDARAPAEVPRVDTLPVTERLACWQEVRPIADLSAFLDALRSGEIRLGDVVLRACELSGSTGLERSLQGPYRDAYATLSARQHAASSVVQPREYLAHHLLIKPDMSMRTLMSMVAGDDLSLDRELLALEHPFNGLAGLARVAVQTTMDPSRADGPQVEVVAPLGASLDKLHLTLRRGELHGAVWAASPATAARCTVGYIAEMEDGAFRSGTVHLESHWDPERPGHATFSLQLGSLARRVTLLLRLGPHLVESETLEDAAPLVENPHLAAYQVMDPGLEHLRRALRLTEAQARKQKDAARHFERAVAHLFSLAGLHVDSLGGFGGTQQAVDVLAKTSDGTVIMAVECTLGALASPEGKASRLMARADDLRRAVELRGAEILPVMVTSRPRNAVPKGDIEFVAHDGIVVLCREELDELTDRVERGATASDVIVFCRLHVPMPASTGHQALSLLRGRAR